MNDEVERMVTTSFLLGLRISQSINNLPPPDRIRYAALIEALEGIIAGEELVMEGATDLKLIRLQSLDLEAIQRDYSALQKMIAVTVLQRLHPSSK
jgi:hypothetical protein